MDLKMAGKVAIVTGGVQGIGRAVVETLLSEGVKVVIADRNAEKGAAVEKEFKQSGQQVAFIAAEMIKPDDIEAMVQFAVDTFGSLDYAVNAAGYAIPNMKLVDVKYDDLVQMVMVDAVGVYLCCQYEIKQMLKQDTPCAIVNFSGNSGIVGSSAGLAGYSMSKHGVVGLTRSAALEYARTNVRVNAVCPGVTETEAVAGTRKNLPEIYQQMVDRIPIGRTGKPEEIAKAVTFLLSDASGYTTGAAFVLDGGHTAA
jgi:NAD(P)-dependent dehydrogenase (short-subunit alcohol dehydrogenase family)